MKQNYELDCLLSPKLSEETARETVQKLADFIQEKNGQVLETHPCRKILLAYPIQKETMAYFQTIDFTLERKDLESLEKKLKETDAILRFLVLKKEPAKRRKTRLRPRLFSSAERPTTPKVELKEIEKKLDEILNEPQ